MKTGALVNCHIPRIIDKQYSSRLMVNLTNNTSQYYQNGSHNGRWLPNYTETAQVLLSQPPAESTIRSVETSTNAANDLTGDNWDLTTVKVRAVIGGSTPHFLTNPVGPWRFTGARTPLVINCMYLCFSRGTAQNTCPTGQVKCKGKCVSVY